MMCVIRLLMTRGSLAVISSTFVSGCCNARFSRGSYYSSNFCSGRVRKLHPPLVGGTRLPPPRDRTDSLLRSSLLRFESLKIIFPGWLRSHASNNDRPHRSQRKTRDERGWSRSSRRNTDGTKIAKIACIITSRILLIANNTALSARYPSLQVRHDYYQIRRQRNLGEREHRGPARPNGGGIRPEI